MAVTRAWLAGRERFGFISSAHYTVHMGTAVRVLGGLGFALFVGLLAVRPFLVNPAITGTLRDGPGGWRVLAVLPLVVVTLLLVALRVRSPSEGTDSQESTPGQRESFWDVRKADNTGVGPAGSGDQPVGETDADDPQEAGTERGGGGQDSSDPTELPGRQGGTRDRAFEIEERPPDATLHEHLEHLQVELDGDETVAGDLQTLEAVARETKDERTIPARCPQDHCDAVWTGRTVLGVGNGRYERLDDGRRVRCLHCEEIHTLE